MKLHIASFIFTLLALLVCKVSSENKVANLDGLNTLNTDKVEELKDEVLERVLTPEDNTLQIQVKKKIVDYLVDTTIEKYENQSPRQEEESEDPNNEAVVNGVRRILQNLFRGNIVAVIQESVAIRAPGPVQKIFADIMGAIFGSKAVQGVGTIGLPQQQPQNATLNGTDITANNALLAPTATLRPTAATITEGDYDVDENNNNNYFKV